MTWTSARRPPAGTMVAAAHRAARRLPRPSPRTATATWGRAPPPPPATEAGEAEPSSIRARRVAGTAAPEEEVVVVAGGVRSTELLLLRRRRELRGSKRRPGRAGSCESGFNDGASAAVAATVTFRWC